MSELASFVGRKCARTFVICVHTPVYTCIRIYTLDVCIACAIHTLLLHENDAYFVVGCVNVISNDGKVLVVCIFVCIFHLHFFTGNTARL